MGLKLFPRPNFIETNLGHRPVPYTKLLKEILPHFAVGCAAVDAKKE
jgi:hypothetical protein